MGCWVVFSLASKNNSHEQVSDIRDDTEKCSDMEASMAISGDVTPTGVTTFVNEACEAVDIFKSYKPSSLTLAQSDLQDLKKYFERPRLMKRGAFTFGSRNQVTSYEFRPFTLPAIFPQWNQRLSGVYALRFSLNFRLQVAATAFHQGVVALNWQYGSPDVNPGLPRFVRGANSASCTNIPHVRLDLSENTMVELKVPFLYEWETMPVLTSTDYPPPDYGFLSLNVILPMISVVGLSAPTYELYAYISDLEFFGADNNASTTITLQSGSIVKDELKNNHLVSKTFTGVSKIASFVARHVPSLSSIAGPVAWASDTAAGVARYFGYSRPLIQDPLLRIFKTPYTSETNVDVPMAGFACGLMQSNTLAVAPEFGATDVDEMSFSFIKKQWAQVCIGSVASTDTHAKVIYASPVTPSVLWFRAPTTAPYCNYRAPASSTDLISQSGNSFLPSHLMHLASYFRFWRGSIKYRFTFSKTKFHGGRYMVSFNPDPKQSYDWGVGISTIAGPEVDSARVQPYGYSLIIDLKDGNVFEFEVPYIVGLPYLNYESSMGGLSMVCIDPLQSSSSVTPTVPFMVEVCGGDDFEVADYAGPYYVPKPNGSIYTQSGEIEVQSGTLVTAVKEPSPITIGERIMSVKQIIQAPFWKRYAQSPGSRQTIIPPWWTNLTFGSVSATSIPAPATVVVTGAGNSPSHWAQCYLYARGSTDLHVYIPNGAPQSAHVTIEQVAQYGTYNITPETRYYTRRIVGSNTPKVVTSADMPLHVRLPAFQQCVRINHCNRLQGFTPNTSPSSGICEDRGHLDILNVQNLSSSNITVWLARAAGDDAALAHYMGPVPQYIPNGTNSNPIDTDWP